MEKTGEYSVKQLSRLLKRDNFGNPPDCYKRRLFLKKTEKKIDDFYLYGNYKTAGGINETENYAAGNQVAADGVEYGKDRELEELEELEDDVEELEEAGEDETLSEETPKPVLASAYTFEDPLKGSDMNKMAMRIEFSKPKDEDEEADIPLDISSPEMDLFSNFIKKSNFGLPVPANPAENAGGEGEVIDEKNGVPFIVKKKEDPVEKLDKGMKNLVDAVLSTGKT